MRSCDLTKQIEQSLGFFFFVSLLLHYIAVIHCSSVPIMLCQNKCQVRCAVCLESLFPSTSNKLFPSMSTREEEPSSRKVPREEGPWDRYVPPITELANIANQFHRTFRGCWAAVDKVPTPPWFYWPIRHFPAPQQCWTIGLSASPEF